MHNKVGYAVWKQATQEPNGQVYGTMAFNKIWLFNDILNLHT